MDETPMNEMEPSYSWMANPPRVTLSIHYTTKLGDELSFSPPASFVPFRKNRDIEELIDRSESQELTRISTQMFWSVEKTWGNFLVD